MEKLTNSQKSIWVMEQYYKGTSVNNICGTAIIEEQVDFEKLKESINIVCKKHDNFKLKIEIENGEVNQVLSELKEIKIETINTVDLKELEKKREEIVRKPFKIENNLLFNFYVFKLQNGFGAFMLNIHHLISDAWTLAFICNEIIKTYSSLKQNQEIETKAIYSYIDYINSEKEYLKSEKFQKDKKYWEEKFQILPEVAKIPGSKLKNINIESIEGKRKQFEIEKSNIIKIKEYCKENQISLYNFFMAIYAIYIAEITNLDEFVIGTPILNRTNFKEKNAAGMFVNTVPFKIKLDETEDFKTFIKNIATESLNMLKHQKYSYQCLLEGLREKNKNIPNLYNILLSYQITNAQMNEGNIKYKTEWTFNGYCADDIEIQIYDLDDTQNLNIAYDYKTNIYEEKDIENLHKRIINIIMQVISHENIKIKEIDIVTPEEKQQLVTAFNKTELEYNKQETVIELFEKQVIKTPNKTAIISNKKELTYKELNEKANKLARNMISKNVKKGNIIGIMLNRSPEMIIGLLAILKCGATYLPIDPEYPAERISYMLENSETKLVLVNNNTEKDISENCIKINVEKVENYENESTKNLEIKVNTDTLAYLIYTSGSTGKPKGVRVTNRNLNNFIKGMKQIIDFDENKIMVSVTTICFDIFGLEIWCSLTAGQTLVVANEVEQNTPALLNKLCLKNKVNMIQTTPSRYSVIFEEKENLTFLENITDILIGGEPVSEKILETIKTNTKAKIFNMYGPTETTIWSTVKELTNQEKITIGKPIANTQCYILNKNHKILPINVPGELYIGGDGVSNGYLKREELNEEKFIKSPFIQNQKIYNTNDLAYYTENGEIVHLGRTDFQVKIRGFRIELGEIENVIEKNENIKQSVVIKSKLKTGHDALIAYYTVKKQCDIEKLNNELRENLNKELPQYMIPQYFMKLEKMPHTPNGKIDRKMLPEVDIQEATREIVKSRNKLDEELIKIISKMLHIEQVSLSDTLLDLGGDSLTAITLSTKILSKFDVQINIKDILSNYTIKDISDYIKENQLKESVKIKIEKAPEQEVYPLSSAQKRIYYNAKMIGENNTVYNMPGGILVDGILDKEKVRKVLDKIIERHGTLRTAFVIHDGVIAQKIQDSIEFEIPIYYNTESELQEIIHNFSKPFALEKEPLIRAELHYIDNQKTLLLVDSHHIIMDGTSLNNLIIEFNRIYNGENLKRIPIQYKDYAIWEEKFNPSDAIKKYENYWLNKFKTSEFAQLDLPYDYKQTANRSYKGSKITNVLDEREFRKIERYAKKIGVSPYMLFISAFFVLLYKYTGQEEIILGSPIANRNINETKRMIGMFVNNIVVSGKVNPEATFQEFLNEIKNQVLDDLSNQPYPFDMLVKKLGVVGDNSRNPLFDVMFTYQNNEENIIKIDDKECRIIEIDNNIAKFNLSLEVKPKIHTINVEYCTDLFKKQTVERLFEHYMNVLRTIVQDNNIKIKDISVMSEKEREKIIYKFNETKLEYPKDKTVAQLFEEQAEKTPNNVALVFEDEIMTYKELNEKSNQLANYLRSKEIKPNDIIGIMLPRSLNLLISILGVLKSGACYIPIDPTYPEKRIDYMLENSQAKLLITTNELYNSIKFKNKICANSEGILTQNNKKIKNINSPEDLAYIIYTSGSTGLPKGVKIEHKNLCNFITGVKQLIDFDSNKVMVSVTTICFDIFGLEVWGTLTSGAKLVIANEDEQHIPALLNKLCIKNEVDMIQTTPSRYSLIFEDTESLEFLKNIKDILVGGEAIDEVTLAKMQENSNARIFNMYGPTETTIWSTVKELTNQKIITIGKPIANTQVYILDKNLKTVPVGIAGELYIAGDGVGQGYLNRDEITKERYLENPFIENSIMYKTGDICKFDERGELHYLGRIDNQVKVRGLRIELEEIEKRILEFPCVRKVKVVKQSIGNREIISAYYISSKRIRITELRNYLHKYLPSYMVPTYFTALDAFPYTPNGKIDKNALPIPNGILKTEENTYIAPKTDLEIKLVSMWEEILNTKPIGMKDNFFELGGDSILAMNLNIKLLKITDKIKYSDIFAYPTVEQLAEKIQSEIEEKKAEDLSELNEQYKDILEKTMILPEKVEYSPVKNVLLTGGTGFLGIHILGKLLDKEKCKIYVLVRKDPGASVKEKLLNKMHYYFGDKYDKCIDDRIIVVQGEISEDGFGLNQEDLFKLGNSIDVIVNSAAKVSHYGSYQEFYNINVKSVEKIINFANAFKKKIFHISTLSVSGNAFSDQYYVEQEIQEKIEFCENNLYVGQKLENVYIRSKFEAERKILEAIKSGTDAYILRMGNLMPRISDGKFQDNIDENAYISRLKTFEKMRCMPEYLLSGYLEFTPIDSAAEAVLKIMQYTNEQNRIYHLFNHNHVYTEQLLKVMSQLGIDIQVIENDKFKEKIKEILNSNESDILNTLINDLDKDLNLNYYSKISLNSKQTIKLLELYGFKWPKIDKRYIENILKLIRGE